MYNVSVIRNHKALKSHYALTIEQRQSLYDAAAKYYAGENRRYHALKHVDAMLMKHDLAYGCSPADDLFIAIILHDAVWLPNNSPKVEELSAALITPLTKTVLGKPLRPMVVNSIISLILETTMANHMKGDLNTRFGHRSYNADHIMDLDLSAMAADWSTFLKTQIEIDDELQIGTMLTLGQRCRGAAKFLTTFIDKSFVFRSTEFQKYNRLALRNLTAFVNLLERRQYRSDQWDVDPDNESEKYLRKNNLTFNRFDRIVKCAH